MSSPEILVSDEDLRRLVEAIVEAFNPRDLDRVASWYAEDALHCQPSNAEPLRGRDEIQEDHRNATRVPFPDFRFELERAFGHRN